MSLDYIFLDLIKNGKKGEGRNGKRLNTKGISEKKNR